MIEYVIIPYNIGSWSRGSSLNRSAEPAFVEPVAAEPRRKKRNIEAATAKWLKK